MEKHTRGPWNTGKKTNDWNYIYSPTGIKVAKCFDPSPAPNHKADGFEIAEANAALVASAPELLELLKFLVAAADTEPGMSIYKAHIELARTVIKKAEQA